MQLKGIITKECHLSIFEILY